MIEWCGYLLKCVDGFYTAVAAEAAFAGTLQLAYVLYWLLKQAAQHQCCSVYPTVVLFLDLALALRGHATACDAAFDAAFMMCGYPAAVHRQLPCIFCSLWTACVQQRQVWLVLCWVSVFCWESWGMSLTEMQTSFAVLADGCLQAVSCRCCMLWYSLCCSFNITKLC